VYVSEEITSFDMAHLVKVAVILALRELDCSFRGL
jgi:hypothetical protein